MSDFIDRAEATALWRRWRLAADSAGAAPDPLLLAAYAEHRLDEAAAQAVEARLALHPEALGDVLAARGASAAVEPSPTALARAMALVPERGAKVLPFRRKPPKWRGAAAWGSMAASIMAVSLLGFELGGSVYAGLLGGSQPEPSFEQTLLDGPATLFSDLGEEGNS
jgi:hypothetical protein